MNYGPDGASFFTNNLKIIPAKRLGIPKEVTLLLKSCNLSFEYKSSRTIERRYSELSYLCFLPYIYLYIIQTIC